MRKMEIGVIKKCATLLASCVVLKEEPSTVGTGDEFEGIRFLSERVLESAQADTTGSSGLPKASHFRLLEGGWNTFGPQDGTEAAPPDSEK